MELVKELEQKLVLNQERHDCNSFVDDHGEVFLFKLQYYCANLGDGFVCHFFGLMLSFFLFWDINMCLL